MKEYLKLMRVHHYLKNGLVFVALFCSRQLTNFDKLISCSFAFLSFCFLSSVIYIINDIFDIQKDKAHSVKCMRPLASGKISVKKAWILAIFLFIAAICCNLKVFSISSSLLLLLYFCLNLFYSFGLKNIPILDIFILVSGFIIRILYGALITKIEISSWLYLTVLSLSFYLALGKRRNEMRADNYEDTRKVLKKYPINFLDKNMGMFLTLANVFYALWATDKNVLAVYDTKYLIFTVPVVLLITLKYSFTVEGDSYGDPVDVVLHDKVLLMLCVFYVLLMMCILYF